MAGCMVTCCNLPEQMYQVDVVGTMVVVGLAGQLFHIYDVRQMRVGGMGAGAAAQFMMHALGCMLDGKGAWGWLCVCARGADAHVCTQGYVSVSVEGWIPVEYFDPSVEWQAKKYVFKCGRRRMGRTMCGQ